MTTPPPRPVREPTKPAAQDSRPEQRGQLENVHRRHPTEPILREGSAGGPARRQSRSAAGKKYVTSRAASAGFAEP